MAPRQRPTTNIDDPDDPALLKELEKSTASESSESDSARDQHDIFNLVALLPIIILTFMNWDFAKLKGGDGFESSWTGEYFFSYWTATTLYFVTDLIWVARVPICVKSPGLIIKHHFVAILYLIAPVLWPFLRWPMGACLSVEINTWFLIARRVVYKRGDFIPSVVVEVINSCFYLTWIAIRCVVYPMILGIFLKMAADKINDTGTLFHTPMLFLPVHFFLCLLNLKWTHDLFKPIVIKWYKAISTGKMGKTTTVSTGL